MAKTVNSKQHRFALRIDKSQNMSSAQGIGDYLHLQFEQMPFGLIIWDADHIVRSWNRAAEKIFGYATDEAIGQDMYDLILPRETIPDVDRLLQRLLRGDTTAHSTNQNRTKDGRVIICDWANTLLRKQDGTMAGGLSICQDVTERQRFEQELRRSEQKMRTVFESIADGIVVLDLDGTILQVNKALIRMHEYSEKEHLVGKSIFELFTEEERERASKKINAVKRGKHGTKFDFKGLAKGGRHFDGQMSLSLLRSHSGDSIGLVGVIRDVTEQKRLRANLQYYVSGITRAQEEERRRVAREMHDDLVQSLVCFSYEIEGIVRSGHPAEVELMRDLKELGRKVQILVHEVRRFSQSLRPDILDRLGLVPALEFIVSNVNDDGIIHARMKASGKKRRLQPEAELVLFRICQEAIHNVQKHSCATEAMISLQFDPETVKLSVADNGKGIDLPEDISHFAAKNKLGVIGMRERARLLGADFRIESEHNVGTRITVSVSSPWGDSLKRDVVDKESSKGAPVIEHAGLEECGGESGVGTADGEPVADRYFIMF
jgi:PAS domain S-box-containing protein